MHKLILILILTFNTILAFAQRPIDFKSLILPAQTFRVSLGGGINNNFINNDDIDSKPSYSLRLAANYQIFPHRIWGITTGLVYTHLSSKTQQNNTQIITNAIDIEDDPFIHHSIFSNYKERQKTNLLTLPILATFRHPLSYDWNIEFALGPSLAYVLNSKYTVKNGTIETQGYYPQYNITFLDLPEDGFYTTSEHFQGNNSKKNFVLNADFNANAVKKLSASSALVFGIFASYSITSYVKKNSNALQYDPDCLSSNGYKNPKYNGALATTSSANSLSYGISVALQFSKPRRPKQIDPQDFTPIQYPQPEPIDSTSLDLPPEEEILPQDDTPELLASETSESPTPDNINLSKQDLQSQINNAGNLTFELDQDNLSKESLKTLSKIADILSANPNVNIEVCGHTCNLGSSSTNYKIGLRRANAVAQQLTNLGIDNSRIKISSAGAKKPVAPNTTSQGRKQNRRVSITIL